MCRVPGVFFATFIIAACASAPRPGTGDLSFRVSWTGKADIDLYVESPLNESINYVVSRAPSGGQLDIDCNYHGVRMCDAPMENIFWPRGAAPDGSYRFWILLVDPDGLQEDDRYSLEVRQGRRVTWSTSGRVADLATRIPHHSFEFPSGVIETITPEDSPGVGPKILETHPEDLRLHDIELPPDRIKLRSIADVTILGVSAAFYEM